MLRTCSNVEKVFVQLGTTMISHLISEIQRSRMHDDTEQLSLAGRKRLVRGKMRPVLTSLLTSFLAISPQCRRPFQDLARVALQRQDTNKQLRSNKVMLHGDVRLHHSLALHSTAAATTLDCLRTKTHCVHLVTVSRSQQFLAKRLLVICSRFVLPHDQKEFQPVKTLLQGFVMLVLMQTAQLHCSADHNGS